MRLLCVVPLLFLVRKDRRLHGSVPNVCVCGQGGGQSSWKSRFEMNQQEEMPAQDGITLREETDADRGNGGGSGKKIDNGTVLRGKRNRVGAACGGQGANLALHLPSVGSGAGGARGRGGQAGRGHVGLIRGVKIPEPKVDQTTS